MFDGNYYISIWFADQYMVWHIPIDELHNSFYLKNSVLKNDYMSINDTMYLYSENLANFWYFNYNINALFLKL